MADQAAAGDGGAINHLDRVKYRRRVLYAALAFDASCVAYLVTLAGDTPLREQAVMALIYAGAAKVGAYVFGEAIEFRGRA